MEHNNKKDDTNMVFGVHPVEELIKAGKELEKVFVQSGLRSPQISEIVRYAKEHEVPVQFVPIEKLNRLTRKNHQVDSGICVPDILSDHRKRDTDGL